MRKHLAVKLALATLAVPLAGYADISGFSGFAPANTYQNSVISTNPLLGYSSDGSTFNLTSNAQSQQASGYFPAAQDISSFTVTFTYQSIPVPYNSSAPDNGQKIAANGISLNFQNSSAGTSLVSGVGNADAMGIGGTAQSASVMYNNYGGFLNYGGSTYVQTGGSVPGPTTASWKSISPVNLSLGNPINVKITYSNGTIRQTLTDTVTGSVAKTSTSNVDIKTAVGAGTALVGFSASTGGYYSTQSVSNFQFTSGTGATYKPVDPNAVYTPISISSGFNKTVIVPASADRSIAIGYVNATPDNGTNITVASTGFTFFEKGFPGSPTDTGLPASGSTFVSSADSRHTFQMPTYNTNVFENLTPDCLVLNTSATDTNGGPGNPSGTLTFETPAKYSAVSLLLSAGHGPVPIAVTANYVDGTSVDIGNATALDWFFNPNPAYSAGARYNAAGDSFGTSTGNVNLYQFDIALPASTMELSGLTLTFDGSSTSNGVATIFAVSGALAPSGPDLIQGDFDLDGEVLDSDAPYFLMALAGDFEGIVAATGGQYSVNDAIYIGDFNGDGEVLDDDAAGFLIALAGGRPAAGGLGAIPEPAALGLLVPTLALSLRRTRNR